MIAAFEAAVRAALPKTALVLGSGLSAVADEFETLASIPYAEIPGLVPPTVAGHRGRLDLCRATGGCLLVAHGRIHRYEGHSVERTTRAIRLFAEWGVRRLILTNAAGGIRPSLVPGDLMVIDKHWKLLDPQAWTNFQPVRIYSADCLARLKSFAPAGGYAALTGPSYETPAEIRALAACGVDAVGMSTAVEAETAASLGLEVVGISCITNSAAGITADPLSHREVEINAKLGVAKLRTVVSSLVM